MLQNYMLGNTFARYDMHSFFLLNAELFLYSIFVMIITLIIIKFLAAKLLKG